MHTLTAEPCEPTGSEVLTCSGSEVLTRSGSDVQSLCHSC